MHSNKKLLLQIDFFESLLSELPLVILTQLWLEPMKKWLEATVSILKIANRADLLAKKIAFARNL